MTLTFITVLTTALFLSSSLQAESTQENPPPHQDISFLQNISHSTFVHMQDIHNFHLAFDDYAFGGMVYESFE